MAAPPVPPAPFVPQTPAQIQGVRYLDVCFRVAQIMGVVSLILLGLTVVLLGVATAQKVHPLAPLYCFGAFGISIIALAIQHYSELRIAKAYDNIPHDTYIQGKKPPPEPNPNP